MINTPLRAELLALQRADLELREQLAKAGALSDSYNDRMAALHRQHNARLRNILSEHGWPGRVLVGEDGAEAAWLVLQHAILDPDLMRGAVSLMEKSVQTGDTEPRYLAALVDRIRTLEGRPQLYGSQYDWDEFGDLNPLPVEDADNVDVRRASVGLEPLAERTHKIRARAAAEGEYPTSDYWEYRRAEREWVRLSGWSITDEDYTSDIHSSESGI